MPDTNQDQQILQAYRVQLAELLRSTRWLHSDSRDEKIRIVRGLECPLPTLRLYRYYKADSYAFESLATDRLTLVNPICFNDPFDGLLYVDEQKANQSFMLWTVDQFKSCVNALRNGLEPELPMGTSVEDVYDGTPVLKLRQPYVEFEKCSWKAARRELFYDMKQRFGDAEEHLWVPNELHLPGWFIDDLKEANVGIDSRTHHYAVIDCIIHRTETVNEYLLFDMDRERVTTNSGKE